jgi:RsiW-degrading membrane proteinase PrsW (M82 family)
MPKRKPIFTKRTTSFTFHISLPPKNSLQWLMFLLVCLCIVVTSWIILIYNNITAPHSNASLAGLYIMMLFISSLPCLLALRDALRARKSDSDDVE